MKTLSACNTKCATNSVCSFFFFYFYAVNNCFANLPTIIKTGSVVQTDCRLSHSLLLADEPFNLFISRTPFWIMKWLFIGGVVRGQVIHLPVVELHFQRFINQLNWEGVKEFGWILKICLAIAGSLNSRTNFKLYVCK